MLTKELGNVDIAEARGGVSRLVAVANRFHAELILTCGDIRANAKSIMGVVAFSAATMGQTVTLTADGEDEAAAAEAIALLLS